MCETNSLKKNVVRMVVRMVDASDLSNLLYNDGEWSIPMTPTLVY
ncbi:TPA: hypothetical protein ACF1RY_001736 [Enterococcus hirae]